MDVELFTSDLGSIPLYREKKRSEADSDLRVDPPRVLRAEDNLNVDFNPEEEAETMGASRQATNKPQRVTPSEDDKPVIIPFGTLGDVEKRMSEQDKRMSSIERTIDNRFSTLENLLKEGVGNPASVMKTNKLTVEPPEDVDEVAEVEQEPVNEEGPFASMSKEEVVDMAMNNPDMIYALRNQGVPPTMDTIQAVAHTTRWIALELTTYTQAAFERSCEDGYEGSLSDFINNAVYKYFADRGKTLQWVDTMRKQPPYYPNPNMYPRRPLGD